MKHHIRRMERALSSIVPYFLVSKLFNIAKSLEYNILFIDLHQGLRVVHYVGLLLMFGDVLQHNESCHKSSVS